MTVPVHDVAAALRQRLPGLPIKKLHKLLYYCQGHHLAAFGEPLFPEPISAWDMGPVVGPLWSMERKQLAPKHHAELGEAELNTVGYVASHYGSLTGNELERLSHTEDPWRLANAGRGQGQTARIEIAWISAWFGGPGAVQDDDEIVLDAGEVRAWLAGAEERLLEEALPDDPDELRRRFAPQS
ncbi:MAG: Panacea domain-containing protein [Sporichthyaceae bacterium]